MDEEKKPDKINTCKTLETASNITIIPAFNRSIKGLSNSFLINQSSGGDF